MIASPPRSAGLKSIALAGLAGLIVFLLLLLALLRHRSSAFADSIPFIYA
jgi:hypothetical protein